MSSKKTASSKKSLRGPGQPEKYKPEYCDMVIAHMSEGYSFESFAGVTDTCVKTIYNWLKDHKEFLHAKRKGEAKCLQLFEKIGKAGLAGKNLNTINWLFQMKCRFHKYGWNPENQNLTFQEEDDEAGFEFV